MDEACFSVDAAYDLEFHRHEHRLRRSSSGWHDVKRHIALVAEPAAIPGSRSPSPSACPNLDCDPIVHSIAYPMVHLIDYRIADRGCAKASPKP
jgi:hypothetical protein